MTITRTSTIDSNVPTTGSMYFNQNGAHVISDGNSSTESSSSELRGWGSIDSRQSYTCLTSLDTVTSQPSSKEMKNPAPIIEGGEGWGHFIEFNNTFPKNADEFARRKALHDSMSRQHCQMQQNETNFMESDVKKRKREGTMHRSAV